MDLELDCRGITWEEILDKKERFLKWSTTALRVAYGLPDEAVPIELRAVLRDIFSEYTSNLNIRDLSVEFDQTTGVWCLSFHDDRLAAALIEEMGLKCDRPISIAFYDDVREIGLPKLSLDLDTADLRRYSNIVERTWGEALERARHWSKF